MPYPCPKPVPMPVTRKCLSSVSLALKTGDRIVRKRDPLHPDRHHCHPNRHPNQVAFRIPFWNVSVPGTRNSGLQKCSAIARRTAIPARFSDTILERIVSRNAKFRDAKMLRDRTPDDHFGSLFGYHSGTYRVPEREIPGCKNGPRSHAGRSFRLAFRIPF